MLWLKKVKYRFWAEKGKVYQSYSRGTYTNVMACLWCDSVRCRRILCGVTYPNSSVEVELYCLANWFGLAVLYCPVLICVCTIGKEKTPVSESGVHLPTYQRKKHRYPSSNRYTTNNSKKRSSPGALGTRDEQTGLDTFWYKSDWAFPEALDTQKGLSFLFKKTFSCCGTM